MKLLNKIMSPSLFVIGVLLFLWIVNKLGWGNIVDAIRNAKSIWLLLSIAPYSFCLTVRALKWHYLFGLLTNQINFRYFVPLYLINSLAGILTPSKSGESLFPFLLKKVTDSSIGSGFSIIYTDRLFDLIVFIILMIISTIFILDYFNPGSFQYNLLLSAFFVLILAAAFLITILFKRNKIIVVSNYMKNCFKYYERLNFIHPTLFRIGEELITFHDGLTTIFSHKKVFQKISFLTLCGWFLELSTYYLIARSFIDISFLNFIPCYIISAGIALASFIPTGIGSGTVSLVYLLSLMEYSQVSATAISLIGLVFPLTILCIFSVLSYIFITRKRFHIFSQQRIK